MGWIKNMLSGSNIVEAGTRAVDSVILTNEEKTEYFLKFVEASLPMNVSRRIIACGVTALWFVGGIIGLSAILLDFPRIDQLTSFMSVYIMPSFTVLTSWYFWRRMGK